MAANMHDGTEDYTLLNVFTPRPKQLDALERLQLSEMKAMSTDAAALGWLGNEVYRTADGTRLVVVTRFRSEAAKQEWGKTAAFAAHVQRLAPLLESVESTPLVFVRSHTAL